MAATASIPLSEAGGTVRVVTTDGGQIRTTWNDVMIDLAQIEDQPSGTAIRWSEEISVGERVLAFVHSSNTDLLAALTAMAKSGSDVAAVVFEGFTAGDDAGNAVNTLLSSGINAISCSRGEFSDAVSRMERGVGAGQSTSAAPVPACEPAATEVEELAA